MTVLHATTIARRHDGEWRGALIQGPSGSGKSDLALRAMAAGWRLVADDRTLVWVSDGRLFARAPATLHGLIEARGLGIMPVDILPMVEVSLMAVCIVAPHKIERMPQKEVVNVLGATLPCVRLFACEASALAKVSLALQGIFTAL